MRTATILFSSTNDLVKLRIKKKAKNVSQCMSEVKGKVVIFICENCFRGSLVLGLLARVAVLNICSPGHPNSIPLINQRGLLVLRFHISLQYLNGSSLHVIYSRTL